MSFSKVDSFLEPKRIVPPNLWRWR